MVFKRRTPRSWWRWFVEGIWPRTGWSRALQYFRHRLRRLPDAPHRIARGIFAGVFVSFTPFFGLHFAAAAAIAWLMRGNIIAALIATVAGNPITFPFIAVLSVELGNRVLGLGGDMTPLQIAAAFGQAGVELTNNFWAAFDPETVTQWDRLHRFWDRVFWPYLIGGIGPGVVAGLVCYYLSLPVIGAYQKLRRKKLAARLEKHRAARAEARSRAETIAVGDAGGAGDAGDRRV